MNGYELSRKWFDFCFDNPEKIKPNHTALYFFCIENCNRLGWKEKFGLPTTMAKDAIGIKNYKTYINTLNDLIDWGFITSIEKSKNQYSANIVALANFTKATTNALDKAMLKHSTKQVQSIASIDKPLNNEQITKEDVIKFFSHWAIESNLDVKKVLNQVEIAYLQYQSNNFCDVNGNPVKDIKVSIRKWFKNLDDFKPDLGIVIDRSPVN